IINIEVAGEGKEVTNIDLVLATDILSMKYAQIKDTLRDLPSGTPINTAGAEGSDLESLFYSEEISEEIKNRINGKSYGEKCDIPYEELRYIRVLYNGFDGKTYIGELIVNRAIVQDIIEIFRELYAINYPIERMVLVDNYEADDIRSMEANNSSAFNYRFIAESSRRSKHSYGIAIDINPLYNPYITEHDGNTTVLPGNAKEYVDRTKDLEYYIQKGDPCYEAFIKRGFTWGGEWKNSKDYQHFEKELEN
ncbi:MAG TPA: M15 family metallopeptidase, partial [Mobilitalea sp.]|nr:M15 family metallopeptidase [Mobilitalea sp.]